MSAIPKEFRSKAAALSAEATRPYPSSRKIYVDGVDGSFGVGMREVRQMSTTTANGAGENPPIYIYDTSGPYTDPNATIDLLKGLPPLRLPWIAARSDTAELPDFTSEYARRQLANGALDHLRFEHLRKPRRAKVGGNVSQMHY